MQDTSPRDISERPSAIVCIAYHQLSIMAGIRDLTVPVNTVKTQTACNGDETMVCTRRLFRLPIFVSVSTTFCDSYKAVKTSHESVTSILNTVEGQLNSGIEYVAPVTEKVGIALETPLKSVDNVICISLNFLEKNVPSIMLPPDLIYKNLKDSFRSMIESFSGLPTNLQNWMNQLLGEDLRKTPSVLQITSKAQNDCNVNGKL